MELKMKTNMAITKKNEQEQEAWGNYKGMTKQKFSLCLSELYALPDKVDNTETDILVLRKFTEAQYVENYYCQAVKSVGKLNLAILDDTVGLPEYFFSKEGDLLRFVSFVFRLGIARLCHYLLLIGNMGDCHMLVTMLNKSTCSTYRKASTKLSETVLCVPKSTKPTTNDEWFACSHFTEHQCMLPWIFSVYYKKWNPETS